MGRDGDRYMKRHTSSRAVALLTEAASLEAVPVMMIGLCSQHAELSARDRRPLGQCECVCVLEGGWPREGREAREE